MCTISIPISEMSSMPLPLVQARKVHPDHTWTYYMKKYTETEFRGLPSLYTSLLILQAS